MWLCDGWVECRGEVVGTEAAQHGWQHITGRPTGLARRQACQSRRRQPRPPRPAGRGRRRREPRCGRGVRGDKKGSPPLRDGASTLASRVGLASRLASGGGVLLLAARVDAATAGFPFTSPPTIDLNARAVLRARVCCGAAARRQTNATMAGKHERALPETTFGGRETRKGCVHRV